MSVEGYCAGRDILEKCAKRFAALPTTNGDWATGDGIELGRVVGADVRDMEAVQVHPTSFLDVKRPMVMTNFLAPEALRGVGGVLVDRKGER